MQPLNPAILIVVNQQELQKSTEPVRRSKN